MSELTQYCSKCGKKVILNEGMDYTFCSSCGNQIFHNNSMGPQATKNDENRAIAVIVRKLDLEVNGLGLLIRITEGSLHTGDTVDYVQGNYNNGKMDWSVTNKLTVKIIWEKDNKIITEGTPQSGIIGIAVDCPIGLRITGDSLLCKNISLPFEKGLLVPFDTNQRYTFLMHVDDVFCVNGNALVTGTAEGGPIYVGNIVDIITKDSKTNQWMKYSSAEVINIEENRKLVTYAQVGHKVGLMLRGIEFYQVAFGDMLVIPVMT